MPGGQNLDGRRPYEWGQLNGGEKRGRREDVFPPTEAIRKLLRSNAIKVLDSKWYDLLKGRGASSSQSS